MADTTQTQGSGFAAVDAAAEALAPDSSSTSGATTPGDVEDEASTVKADAANTLEDAKSAVKSKAADLRTQASDKALSLVGEGKSKATGALDHVSQMLTDAADTVDEKLGEQYGQYARNAAETVQSFSASINDKSVEDVLEDVRGFVNRSPALAIGIATALGFVAARIVGSGLDQRDGA